MLTAPSTTNPRCPFEEIPDEILQLIFSYLQATDLITNVIRVNRRWRELVDEPLLWRQFVFSDFNYWNPKTDIRNKPSTGVRNWRSIYMDRLYIEHIVKNDIQHIITNQHGRIEKAERIASHGYLAKDALRAIIACPDDTEDVLARRYHATQVLDHIQRAVALDTWVSVIRGEDVTLEQALGAFDLFILHEMHGDCQEVLKILDQLLIQINHEIDMQSMTSRQKAMALQKFLKEHNLVNLCDPDTSDGSDYQNIENNYLSLALQDEHHPSLPLISGVIYCFLAKRIGVNAQLCGYPQHIYARIQPNPGQTLDDTTTGDVDEPMFLDPWRATAETPLLQLQQGLTAMGIPDPSFFDHFLTPASVANLTLRASRNIIHSCTNRHAAPPTRGFPSHTTSHPNIDVDTAFYSCLWANLILRPSPGDPVDEIRFLPMLLTNFERLFPYDVGLIARYMIGDGTPDDPCLNIPNIQEFHIPEILAEIRAADNTPPESKRRDSQKTNDDVKFRVGQVFKHKRYEYFGLIVGWDVECSQNTEWMQHNRIDSLSRGRRQSFYHVLCADSTLRYVAEENIAIHQDKDADQHFIGLAGKYMKRWDAETMRFVSNIKDEYPDD